MATLVFLAKSLLILVLSSFVVVTAVSFLRVRVKKREVHFKNIIRVLGLADDEVRLFTPAVRGEMIEGINAFHEVRLAEVGIDNAQNLAEANVIEPLLKTPFNVAQLIDWIAQAKLYVAVKADIEKLRRVGMHRPPPGVPDAARHAGREQAAAGSMSETTVPRARPVGWRQAGARVPFRRGACRLDGSPIPTQEDQ